jgi:Tfp pilus assembly PilM family ATPase
MKQAKIRRSAGGRTTAPSGVSVDAVGVELAIGSIRLVRTRRGVVEDYTRILLPPTLALSSPEYREILSSSLHAFCKHHPRAHIWATAPFPKLSVRHLRIPKVPRRQLSLAVRWALHREMPGDLQGMFVDYTIGSEVNEHGVRKINVTACAVRREDIERLNALFVSIGCPLKGLTTPFFTYPNMVAEGGYIPTDGDRVFLDVGLGATQILVTRGGQVALHSEFRLGVTSFLDSCVDHIPEGEALETFMEPLEGGGTSVGRDAGERERILQAFEPVLLRLLRKISMTLDAHDLSLDELALGDVLLSGPLATCDEVREFMADHLGHPVLPLNPLEAASLADGHVPPVSPAASAWFTPAVGLALSPNTRTLNLLRPIQSRWERAADSTINQFVIGVSVAAAVLICAVWGVASVRSAALKRSTLALEARIARTDLVTVASLKPSLEVVVTRDLARYTIASDRYVLAIIAELANLTSAPVEWVACDVKLGSLSRKLGRGKVARGAQGTARIHIVGRVRGERSRQAAELAAYQIALDESELFAEVEVKMMSSQQEQGSLEFSLSLRPVSLTNGKKGEA